MAFRQASQGLPSSEVVAVVAADGRQEPHQWVEMAVAALEATMMALPDRLGQLTQVAAVVVEAAHRLTEEQAAPAS